MPGTPFPVFTPEKEVKRQAVNAWIRTGGEYDAVIDFDRVLRDPTLVVHRARAAALARHRNEWSPP